MADQVLTSLDLVNPEYVEIIVGIDNKTIWVNVEGVCRFRARRIESLSIVDERVQHREIKHDPGSA